MRFFLFDWTFLKLTYYNSVQWIRKSKVNTQTIYHLQGRSSLCGKAVIDSFNYTVKLVQFSEIAPLVLAAIIVFSFYKS
jgi:hypothetical protein